MSGVNISAIPSPMLNHPRPFVSRPVVEESRALSPE